MKIETIGVENEIEISGLCVGNLFFYVWQKTDGQGYIAFPLKKFKILYETWTMVNKGEMNGDLH